MSDVARYHQLLAAAGDADEVDAVLGETQRFECQVIGFPTPTIRWYKDEIDITDSVRYNIDYSRDDGVTTLVIRNVSLADEGLYQCRAENSEGVATTTAYLVVRVDPTTGSTKDYSSMTFEKVSEEEHSQVEVHKSSRQTVIEEVITRVEETEREVIEEKSVAPRISYDAALRQALSINCGSTVYIEVRVTGHPRPSIQWFRGDTILHDTSKLSIETSEGWSHIKIKSACEEDAGLYRVTAENVVGIDSAEFRVIVKAPPSPPRNVRIVEVSRDYVLLAWEPPSSDGNEKIIGYEIEKSLISRVGGSSGFVSAGYVDGSNLSCRVSRLHEGCEYLFRVCAENRIGLSQPVTTEQPVLVKLPFDVPSAPRNLYVKECSKDYVDIAWSAPSTDGGSEILQYIIEKRDVTRGIGSWMVCGTVSVTECNFRASKLFQGNAYQFRVSAENRVGTGPVVEMQEAVVAQLPFDKPSAPRNVRSIEVDSTFITVAWDAPAVDGGSPVTGYVVEKKDSKRGEYMFVSHVDSTTMQLKATRLFEGVDYMFRVFAENPAGLSSPSETDKPIRAKVPYDEPSAPRNLRVKDYWTDFITILWDSPQSDGGAPISNYVIEKRDASRPTWVKAGTVDADNTLFKATNLFEGVDYIFRVYAVNKVGPSREAAELDQPCKAKMPFDPPFKPRELAVLDYNVDFVTLTWKAPEHDGGSSIIGYVVEKRDTYMNMWSQVGKVDKDTLGARVTGLFEGQSYMFRVAAENQCGRGEFIETVKPAVARLPFDTPSEPRNLQVKECSKDYIDITWIPPETDGGSEIQQYVIERRDVTRGIGTWMVSGTTSATESTFRATKLFQGNAYQFRVSAENRVGAGPPAEMQEAAVAELPFDKPSAPRNVRPIEVDSTFITVAWDAPTADGGSPVTGYVVEKKDSKRGEYLFVAQVDSATRQLKATRLFEGVDYMFRVFAENPAGLSSPSETDKPITAKQPYDEPSAPRNLRVKDYWTDFITVQWDSPQSDGGSPITSYVIEKRDASRPTWVKAGTVDALDTVNTLFKATNLFEGVDYLFRVYAVNKVGPSREAAELDRAYKAKMPFDPPFAPQDLKVVEYNTDYMTLSWKTPEHDGGSEILGYHVEKRDTFMNMWSQVGKVNKDALGIRASGLFEGQSYLFRVAAENQCGRGEYVETGKPTVAKLPYDTPSAPRSLQVKDRSKDFIDISWSPPETDGGSEVRQYVIEKRDVTRGLGSWMVSGTTSATDCNFRVSKLLEGNSYQLRVSAENRVGAGPPVEMQEAVVAQLPFDKPSQPRNVRPTEIDATFITIAWDAPETDGGSPVVGYVVEKADTKRGEYMFVAHVDSSTTELKVTRLFEGVDYLFRVFAENLAGMSSPSETDKPITAKLPYDEPSAPRNLRVKEYWTDFITVTWDSPQSDGGSPLTGYVVEKRDISRPTWVKAGTVEADTNLFKITNLFESAEYLVRVYAVNKVGPSRQPAELDQPCKAKMPFDPPFAPQDLKVVEYNTDYMTLSWKAPEHDGGSEILGYLVEKLDTSMQMWSQVGKVNKDTLGIRVSGLFEGQSYLFRVVAENQCGRGQYATTVDSVTAKLPFDKPSKPTNLQVSEVWKDYITVTWEPPLKDGGSPLLRYTLEQRDALQVGYQFVATVDASQTLYQFTNLQEGHDYFFRVFANNAGGQSDQPAELKPAVRARLPFELPNAPTGLRVTNVDSTRLTLAWDKPLSDGGSPITGYVVEIFRSGSTSGYTKEAQVDGSTLTVELTGLTEGEFYFVRVFSENLVGLSKKGCELSEPVCAKAPQRTPGAPRNLQVTDITTDSVSMSWESPESDGTNDVLQYSVDMREEQQSDFTSLTTLSYRITSYTVEHLQKGRLYRFRVRSKNSAGFSGTAAELESPVEVKTPLERPSVPFNLKLSPDAGGNAILLSWDITTSDVDSFIVEMKGQGEPMFTPAGTVIGKISQLLIEHLVKTKIYTFRVVAKNSAGESDFAQVQMDAPLQKKEVVVEEVTEETSTKKKKKEKKEEAPAEVKPVEEVKTEDEPKVKPKKTKKPQEAAPEVTEQVKAPETKPVEESVQLEDIKPTELPKSEQAPVEVVKAEPIVPAEKKPTEEPKPAEQPKPTEAPKPAEQPKPTEAPKPAEQPKPAATLPLPPIGFHVVSVSHDLLSLAWQPAEANVLHYIIVIREANKKKFKKIAKVDGTQLSCTINTGFENNQKYVLRIYAENEVGIGPEAAEVSVAIPAKPSVKAEAPQVAEPQLKKAEEPQQVPEPVPTVTEEPKVDKKKKTKPEKKTETKVEVQESTEVQQAVVTESVKEAVVEKPELVVQKPVAEPVVKPTEEAQVLEEQILPVQKAKVEQGVSMLVDIPRETQVAEVSEEEEESSEEEVVVATPVKPVEAPAPEIIEDLITKDKAPVDKEAAPALEKLLETVPKPQPESMPEEESEEEESEEEESEDEESEEESEEEAQIPQAVKKPKKVIQLPQASVTESKTAGKLEASTELVVKEESSIDERTAAAAEVLKQESVEQTEEVMETKEDLTSSSEEVQQKSKKKKQAIKLPQASVTESATAGKVVSQTEVVTKEESGVSEVTVETTQNESTVTSETATLDEASIDQESITVQKTDKKSKKSKRTVELPQATVTQTETSEKLETRTEQLIQEESVASSQVSVEQVQHEQEIDEEEGSEEEEAFSVPSGFSDITVSDLTSDSVVLSWTAPKDDGGSQITTYIVVMRESDKNKFKKIGQVQADTFTYQVTKIKEGHEYFFRVYAQNGVGISTESATTTTSVVVPKRKKDKKEKQTTATEQEVVEEVREDVTSMQESVEETVHEIKQDTVELAESQVQGTQPVFEKKLLAATATEGETVRLTCTASGEPLPEATWFKGKKPVKKSKRIKQEVNAETKVCQLEITNATVEDSGEYTVQLTNQSGTVRSTTTVTVASSGEDVTDAKPVEQQDTAVEEETAVKKKKKKDKADKPASEAVSDVTKTEVNADKIEADKPCLRESTIAEEFKEVGEKSVLVEETSVKKKKKLRDTSSSTQETSESLEVTVVSEETSTESKEITQETEQLSEEEEAGPLPLFEVKPEPTTTKEGEAVKLTFKLAEEPPAEVTWAKNGKKIKKSKKDKRLNFGVDEQTGCNFLEIVETTMEDTGEYTLTAESEGGIVACTVSVNVLSKVVKLPPRIEEFPKPQTVREGGVIELVCKVSGVPEPQVTVCRNGEQLKIGKTGDRIKVSYKDRVVMITVVDVKVEDSGEYTITAVNERGKIYHAVTVCVQPAGVEYADTGVIAPEFISRLQPVTVLNGENLKLETAIKGTDTSVSWFKDGKPLKTGDGITISQDGDKFTMEVTKCTVTSAGEYTCTASNSSGSACCTANVIVADEQDYIVMTKLSEQIDEQRKTQKLDDKLLKRYRMRDSYSCHNKQVTLSRGDVVEVLDTEKKSMWLVRMYTDKEKVCYVPVELLVSEDEYEEEESEEEEEQEEVQEEFPVYTAIANYNPTDSDGLPLNECDEVELLDNKSPDKWLCRLLNNPNKRGWVPPSYLVSKSEDKLDTRTTQEVFREDIIKISNKQQEAVMKRRYALKDLWESEREYVRDLTTVMETYFKKFEGTLPAELSGKRDVIFTTFPEIFNFHNDLFLDALMNCSNDADVIADTFLNNREHFQQYIPYFKNRNQSLYLIDLPEPKKFFKEYDLSIGNVGEKKLTLPEYLTRPWSRIDEYITILKDLLKYTAKAQQDFTKLELAIEMMMELKKQAEDLSTLDQIRGYIGDLSELGPVYRHDDFIIWEGEPTGKGKDRHMFLFKNKLLLTRKKKPENPGELPTYEFREMIDLTETLLNDELTEERRFELCFEDLRKGKYTFQAKTLPIKQAWCDLLRRWLRKWGAKPAFAVSLLEKTTCKEGEQVKLRCKLEGQPLPQVTWHFNDVPIEHGDKYTVISDFYEFILIIPRATLDLAGTYTITAKNQHGVDKMSTQLIVEEELEKPTFNTELSDCETLLGKDAQFACKLFGKPSPKISWYKDGVELSASDRIKFISPDDRTFIMILSNAEEADLGVYECRATNKVGTLSSKAQLLITDLEERKKERAPEFLSNFNDILVTEGSEAKLALRFVGYPAPEVSWLFNGSEIGKTDYFDITRDNEEACFYIRIARPEHTGSYTCQLRNKFGLVEVTAQVSVAVKPQLESRLTDQDAVLGTESRFTCKYTGFPVPDVTWYHNKYTLTDTERIRIERTESEISLIIKKVMRTDDGDYSFRMVNAAGEVVCSAKLYVQEPVEEKPAAVTYAPSITKRIQSQDVLLGAPVKFTCKAIGEPRPTVAWLKDGLPLELRDQIVVESEDNTFRLVIREAQLFDAGVYQCIISNSAGETTCTAALIVQAIMEEEEETVRKKKEKVPIIINTSPSMPLQKPVITDIDYFNIDLSWPAATLPANATPTSFTYIIERKILGRNAIDEWLEVERNITEIKYRLTGYDPQVDCLYRIRAINEFGTSDPSLPVPYYGKQKPTELKDVAEIHDELMKAKIESRKERVPPRAPKDKPTVVELKDDELQISWTPGELPEYAVTTDIYYVVERRCPPSKNWLDIASDVRETTFVMKDYRPEKDYMFRIRSGNEYGVSDPTTSTTLFAKPDADSKKKKDVEEFKSKAKPRTIWDKPDIVDITSDSFTLRWKPSSVPNYAVQTPIWYIVEQRVPPSLEWTKIATDLKEPELKLSKYNRSKDYYFRVKAVNEFGMAEPSMPAMLKKKEEVQEQYDEINRRKKFELKDDSVATRRVPEHLRIPPEFLGKPDDVQYGIEGRPSQIIMRLRAYPEPKITWYFHNMRLEMCDKFTSSLSSNGELILQIEEFTWTEVGEYKVEIENEFGTATHIIKMDMSDPPTFLEPLKDQVFHLHQNGKLECRVGGIPYPKVYFKKDWRNVASSYRVKTIRESQDHWTLNIQNAIRMDEGVYECIAENLAGKVYCTANVKITEKAGVWREIKFNSVPVEEYFHLIDEIGRGSHGVVRRVIDKNSGNQYAAKFLRYNDPLMKEELMQELEIMSHLSHTNIIQVIDGYEDKKRLAIVMEIVTGGEVLQRFVNQDNLTESEAAFYLRQVLLAVEFMHSRNVIHLDLKPENLLLLDNMSDEIKVIDFGFARSYNPNRKIHAKYATPEFCAPEVANDNPVTPAADLWSVGIIAYIILSGLSPFHKESARETLLAVQEGQWSFDSEAFSDISHEAKDFISKLLEKDPKKRLTATEAIEHPFLELANHRGLGNRIALDRHRAYMFRRKWERGLNLVKTIVQPKLLSSYLVEVPVIPGVEVAISVPLLQLPGMDDELRATTPLEAGAAGMLQVMGPPHVMSAMPSMVGSNSSSEWGREYEDEDTWYEPSSSYQTGPETQLFPSKDTGLSVRMAKYRRTAQGVPHRPGPGSVGSIRSSMKERQDLRELDKEIEKEDVLSFATVPRHHLWHLQSLTTSSDPHDGFPPVFKQKIHDKAYNVGVSCTLKVHTIGNPMPLVTWYRNEELLSEGGRIRIARGDDGRHSLTVLQTKPNDFGVYKCVARNKYGTVTCRARMLCGDVPSRPGRPHVTKVSEQEVFLLWEEPETDGNCYIQAYKVDWIKPGDDRWTSATYCIDECALIKSLRPDTTYRFRVSAINQFGQSPYSWASIEIRTKKKGSGPSVDIDEETKRILLRSRQAANRPSPEPSPTSSQYGSLEDLSEEKKLADDKATELGVVEREIHLQETDPAKYMDFGAEIWRGRFSMVRDVDSKDGMKPRRVAKISVYDSTKASDSLREFEMLKAVRQEHVVRIHEAFLFNDFVILVFEKLYGESVVRSLSLKNRYNEHIVTEIIKQLLDAVQFLHHRGIVHLNIQPDNVVMHSRRRFDVKLIDFGLAHKINTVDGDVIDRVGAAEFMAPEKVAGENVGVAADIWGVGVLAFILLSGVSPFNADAQEDTFANIKHVRYDANALYHNVTKYSMKFIYQTLRRNPRARLTTEECLDHRWLMLNSAMVKSRRAAIFTTDKLKCFVDDYTFRRMRNAQLPDRLISTYGSPAPLEMFSYDEDTFFNRRRVSLAKF